MKTKQIQVLEKRKFCQWCGTAKVLVVREGSTFDTQTGKRIILKDKACPNRNCPNAKYAEENWCFVKNNGHHKMTYRWGLFGWRRYECEICGW